MMPREDMRLQTILKKAQELATLCEVETGLVYYGPEGRPKIWSKQERDLAMTYKDATKPKKIFNLQAIQEKKKLKKKKKKPKQPKPKPKKLVEDVNGGFDQYSDHQLSQLNLSLRQTCSILEESLAFIEAEAQKQSYADDNYLNPNHFWTQQQQAFQTQQEQQQFSLCVYNHQDDTFSQLPLPNQDIFVPQPIDCGNINNDDLPPQDFVDDGFYHNMYLNTTQDIDDGFDQLTSELFCGA